MKDETKSGCYACVHFSLLVEPMRYDETTFIHGYCFKNLSNQRNGYPVYLPNGYCKERKVKIEEN